MLTYCLKYKENAENKNPEMIKTKNGRLTLSSKCSVCGTKKLRFMKEQEAKRFLSSLGLKMPLLKFLF